MIIRAEKKGNFTILPNEFLLDDTISDKARGTLARLLSRPDVWNMNVNFLVKTGKDGHTAIRSAIKELEDAGYIQKDISRHSNGRIIGVEYIIRESPVKSCGDMPASKPEHSCNQTEPREVQAELFDDTSLPAHELETINQETQAQDIQVQGANIKDALVEGNRMRKTVIKETAPIIKTDIKQILKVTTTTTPEPVICDQAVAIPLPCPSNAILNLIPEKHRSPMVISLVNKAIVDYPERDVEDAIAYAAGNVRGGSLQFKAYLDKTLKNKWAVGYLESREEPFSFGGFGPGQFPNGFTTGSKRLDGNLAACLEFAAYSKRKGTTA